MPEGIVPQLGKRLLAGHAGLGGSPPIEFLLTAKNLGFEKVAGCWLLCGRRLEASQPAEWVALDPRQGPG